MSIKLNIRKDDDQGWEIWLDPDEKSYCDGLCIGSAHEVTMALIQAEAELDRLREILDQTYGLLTHVQSQKEEKEQPSEAPIYK